MKLAALAITGGGDEETFYAPRERHHSPLFKGLMMTDQTISPPYYDAEEWQ